MAKKLYITKLESKKTGKPYIALVYANGDYKRIVNVNKFDIARIGDMKFSEMDNMEIGAEIIVLENK